MKNLIFTCLCCVGFLGAPFTAYSAPKKKSTVTPKLYCKNVETACLAAGFKKIGHKADDGMWKACMQPLLAGTNVASVTVDPADIAGCQALQKTPG